MFIVLVRISDADGWLQFDEPVTSYNAAWRLTAQTSLPWLITVVIDREAGVTL